MGIIFFSFFTRKNTSKIFTIDQITTSLKGKSEWNVPPLSPPEQEHLFKLLDQRFTFLGAGKQCFAFSSEDNEYVIKFFKGYRLEVAPWLKYLASLPLIHNYYEMQLKKKNKRMNELFSSCKLAYEELQEETGLIFLHLNKTSDLNKKITLVAPHYREYNIYCDDYEFLIQRKARSLCSTFSELKKENKIEEAQTLIDQLLTLILKRLDKGITDFDPFLMHNSGFLKTCAIHIDTGRFAKFEAVKNAKESFYELHTTTRPLRDWLEVHYPELGTYMDTKILTLYE